MDQKIWFKTDIKLINSVIIKLCNNHHALTAGSDWQNSHEWQNTLGDIHVHVPVYALLVFSNFSSI